MNAGVRSKSSVAEESVSLLVMTHTDGVLVMIERSTCVQ